MEEKLIKAILIEGEIVTEVTYTDHWTDNEFGDILGQHKAFESVRMHHDSLHGLNHVFEDDSGTSIQMFFYMKAPLRKDTCISTVAQGLLKKFGHTSDPTFDLLYRNIRTGLLNVTRALVFDTTEQDFGMKEYQMVVDLIK